MTKAVELRRVFGWSCGRAVVVGLALLAFVGVYASADGGLLRAAAQTLGAEQRQRLEEDPFVLRWRVAGMASERVFAPSAWDEPLALNLFPDAELAARVRSAKTLESGSLFLSGTLVGGGHFTLLRSAGGILRGEFHSGHGVFTLRSQGPGRVLVAQRDVSKMDGNHHHHHHHHHHDATPEAPALPANAPATQHWSVFTPIPFLMNWGII